MPPSKQEILERYRDKIAADDFEILVADKVPTPIEAHQHNEGISVIGKIGEWIVWTKKKLIGRDAGILVVFVTLIDVFQACEWLHPKIITSYDNISNYISSYITYEKDTPSYYVAFEPKHQIEQKFSFATIPENTQFLPVSGSHPLITGKV